jgi:hypothetical protein
MPFSGIQEVSAFRPTDNRTSACWSATTTRARTWRGSWPAGWRRTPAEAASQVPLRRPIRSLSERPDNAH